jgi:hypothetical protein
MKKQHEVKQNPMVENHIEVDNRFKRFYNLDGNLALPRDADCYFNWQSSTSSSITLNAKLLDLGFLQAKGFDLKAFIDDNKRSRFTHTKSIFSQTIIYYIMYIRYLDYYPRFSEILLTLSEKKLLELFLFELNLVYDSEEHDINCMFWSDKTVLEAANKVKGDHSEQDKLVGLISSSEMMKNTLTKEPEKE